MVVRKISSYKRDQSMTGTLSDSIGDQPRRVEERFDNAERLGASYSPRTLMRGIMWSALECVKNRFAGGE